jgi:archaellum component FlaC
MDQEKIIDELSTRIGDIVSNYELVIAKLKVRAQEEVDRISDDAERLQREVTDLTERCRAYLLTIENLEGNSIVQEEQADPSS